MRERKIRQLLPLISDVPTIGVSLGRDLKSVYAMRDMLQEVGILYPLVYFHLKDCLAGFL